MKNVRRDRSPARVMVADMMKVGPWFTQEYVFEVQGPDIAESPMHTSNLTEEEKRKLTLRFPRFERWKSEKTPKKAASARETANMFLAQNEVKVADD